jgi:hypothetical protein
MAVSRVWIVGTHKLYLDLLTRVFRVFGHIEVIGCADQLQPDFHRGDTHRKNVDVIVIPMENPGLLKGAILSFPNPEAKWVIFSLNGNYGLTRLPGDHAWREVKPFGLKQLLQEVFDVQRHKAFRREKSN